MHIKDLAFQISFLKLSIKLLGKMHLHTISYSHTARKQRNASSEGNKNEMYTPNFRSSTCDIMNPQGEHSQYTLRERLSKLNMSKPDAQIKLQKYELRKDRSAINELQDLITPRATQTDESPALTDKISLWKESQFCALKNQDRQLQREHFATKTDQKSVSKGRRGKEQQEMAFTIQMLQRKLKEAQKAKKMLQIHIQSQTKQISTLQEQHKELQDLFKKQMIVNLELQVLLANNNIKHQKELKQQNTGIEPLKNQLSSKNYQLQNKEKAKNGDILQIEELTLKKDEGNCQISLKSELAKKNLELLTFKSNKKCDLKVFMEKIGNSTVPKTSQIFDKELQLDSKQFCSQLQMEDMLRFNRKLEDSRFKKPISCKTDRL